MSPNPRRNHRSSAVQEATTATAPRETRAGAASRPRKEAPDTVTLDDEKLRAQVVDSSVPSARGHKAQHSKKKHHRHHHHHHHKSRDAHSLDTDDYDRMKAPKKPPIKSATRRTPHSDSHHRKHKRENLKSYETMVQDDIEMQMSETAKTERVQSSSLPTSRNHNHCHSAARLRETTHSTRHGSHQHHRKSRASGKVARPVPSTTTSKPHPPTRRGGRFNSRDDSSRPEECPRSYSKETTDQTVASGKVLRPFPPTTTFQLRPSTHRRGQFQEEGLDSKLPSIPHFLEQDDLNNVAIVDSEDNFHDDVRYHDKDLVDNKNTRRGLAMASGTPAYQPRREAAMAHDEQHNFDDIETAMGHIEPPTTMTQAPVCPGAFREGGGPQDDEETLFTAPEQIPVPPSQSSTLDNVIAEAELVEEGEPSLVIADIAEEKWWTKRRNVCILIAAIVLVLLGVLGAVLGAVLGTMSGGESSDGGGIADNGNDICSNATPLTIPSSVEGSTTNGTLDNVGIGTPCEPNARGIWYTVVGTGNNIIASTCNEDTSYNTAISVFRGGCSDLQCVAYNDYGGLKFLCELSSGWGSRAVWSSVRGETYSVLVHGYFSYGDYRLDISQVDPVENDVCEDAISLSLPSSVEGSTVNAILDDVGTDTPCREPYAPGIWYTVVGTGNNIIASTCNEDTSYNTTISVFRGGCSSLQCVAQNDRGPYSSCASSTGRRSRAVWTSIEGETYLVLVHGWSIGDFRLDISQVDPVENDVCEDAIPLSIPASVEGSTINATLNDVGTDYPCESRASGIWYSVVGTGNQIIASTCNEETSYDTAISVFRGGCSGLQCVAHNDYGPDSLCGLSSGWGSHATWTSIEGETYSILVHGVSRSAIGDFHLDISQVIVENDVCEEAIALSIPSSVEGSTMNAILDDVGTDTPCESYAPGIWYTVVGTGNTIIASTCNNVTSYDTAISVFRGGCSGLQCVAHNDYGGLNSCYSSSGSRSRAVWTSIEGETYSVLVHGTFGDSIGDFHLDISQVIVENNVCADAIALSIPSSVEGSTINATIDAGLPCGGFSPGVWYSIAGTGNTITASLCNDATLFNTYLAVFRGSCSSLECMVENDRGGGSCGRQSRVSWTATRGVMYYVLVHGSWSESIGDFRLDIS